MSHIYSLFENIYFSSFSFAEERLENLFIWNSLFTDVQGRLVISVNKHKTPNYINSKLLQSNYNNHKMRVVRISSQIDSYILFCFEWLFPVLSLVKQVACFFKWCGYKQTVNRYLIQQSVTSFSKVFVYVLCRSMMQYVLRSCTNRHGGPFCWRRLSALRRRCWCLPLCRCHTLTHSQPDMWF